MKAEKQNRSSIEAELSKMKAEQKQYRSRTEAK
jgi:hypothetical protein